MMRVQDLTAESRNLIASDEGVKMRYVHTCYRVLDLDRSIDFYKDKLGLELARKVPIGDDATNAFFSVPGDPEPRLELTLNHDQDEPYELGTGYSHVAFAVEDLDALAEKLEEAGGVDFESKPHAMSSGTRIFFVRDPDGYRIEFIERP
jgi:lactoylglutathione lyase